jgi:hypothetical protein
MSAPRLRATVERRGPRTHDERGAGDRLFVAALTLVALLALGNLWTARRTAPTDGLRAPAAAGSVRDVDPMLIRRLIQEGKLSDHEAAHYRRLDHERADAGAR